MVGYLLNINQHNRECGSTMPSSQQVIPEDVEPIASCVSDLILDVALVKVRGVLTFVLVIFTHSQ